MAHREIDVVVLGSSFKISQEGSPVDGTYTLGITPTGKTVVLRYKYTRDRYGHRVMNVVVAKEQDLIKDILTVQENSNKK